MFFRLDQNLSDEDSIAAYWQSAHNDMNMSLLISGEILKHKSTPWSILWAWIFCKMKTVYKSYET